MTTKIISTLCAFVLNLWASLAWAGEPLRIPGTGVSLEPPKGFALSKDFAGLQGDGASVLIVEIPEAIFETMVARVSAGSWAKQGVDITSGGDFTGLPFRARVYRGRQFSEGQQIDKWLLMIDSKPTFTMLNVSALKGAPLSHAQVLEMFKSVRIAGTKAADLVDSLPYTIAPRPRFTDLQVLPGSMLRIGTEPPTADSGLPALIIVRSGQPVPRERWLAAVEGLREPSDKAVTPPTPTKVGNLEGLEQKFSGAPSGEPPFKALRVVLFTTKDVYLLTGMSSPELFDGAEMDFRLMIGSFRLK